MKNKKSTSFELKRLSLCTLIAAATSVSHAAPVLEELIITARKDSEGQQTTPVAVTALNQDMLTKKQIAQIVDLQRTAPSLSIGTGGTGPASIIYAAIRGQAQNSPNSVTDAAVGVYINNVYLGRPIASNQGVLDVAQVEVLRGPQGTLFGRNTTGGALNITTNWPTGEFEGHVKAEVGNYNLRSVETIINVPINGNELATRFAYRYNERDGYVDNPNYEEGFKDVDSSYSGRASILFAPDDIPVEVFFSLDHEYYRDNGTPSTVIAYNDDAQAAPGLPTLSGLFASVGLNPRDYEQNGSNFFETYGFAQTPVLDDKLMTPSNYNQGTGITLDVQFELGDAILKSVTAYRKSLSSNQNDLDGSPVDIISFFSEYSQHQFSQEVQLSGEIGALQLTGGLYHFQEGGDEFSHAHQFGVFIQPYGAAIPFIPFDYRNTYSQFNAKSQGAFLQGNYDITDDLRLTAGYRYTRDQRRVRRAPQKNYIPQAGKPVSCGLTAGELGISSTQFAALPLSACNIDDSAGFSYPAYLLSLDYKINEDLFVYFKHSRASMAGNLNTREVPAPYTSSVQPETVKDVEIGMKADMWDRRLRANVAAFYMEGSDVQRIVNAFASNGSGLTQFNTNTGDTKIQGLEIEISLLPWDGLEINFSTSLMDGEYVSGTFNETRGTVANPILVDRSNEELPRLPSFSYSLGATQTVDMGFGELSAHLDYSYIDDQAIVTTTATPGSTAQQIADAALINKYSTIEGYGVLNARISLTVDDSNLEFSIWGRNLLEEEYATNVFESWNALGFALQNQGDPRTIGATVQYNF